MPQKIIVIIIFSIMVTVWCVAAKYLSRHPLVAGTVDKFGHIIFPIVLILLGIYILYQNGSFKLL